MAEDRKFVVPRKVWFVPRFSLKCKPIQVMVTYESEHYIAIEYPPGYSICGQRVDRMKKASGVRIYDTFEQWRTDEMANCIQNIATSRERIYQAEARYEEVLKMSEPT